MFKYRFIILLGIICKKTIPRCFLGDYEEITTKKLNLIIRVRPEERARKT